jgi:preprotein translocase subunit SecB
MEQSALYPIQLLDVRLYEATIKRFPVDEIPEVDEDIPLPVQIDLDVVKHSTERASVFLTMDVLSPTQESPEFHLRFTVEGLFESQVALDEIDRQTWDEFKDVSALSLLWPYARECMHSFAKRMHVDVPILPTLHRLAMSAMRSEETTLTEKADADAKAVEETD